MADEHIPPAVLNRLRALGHDVVAVRQLMSSKSGDGWGDDVVLAVGEQLRRAVITSNGKHFRTLAASHEWHEGIVICNVAIDLDQQGEDIHAAATSAAHPNGRLTGQVVEVRT